MARRGKRDRSKEWFWRRVLRQWQRSGQGVRPFCAAHGLSEPLFYAWRRTIQERNQQAQRRSRPDQRPAPDQRGDEAVHPLPSGEPAFVPVTLALARPALEVVLPDGRVLRVPSGFEPATLRQLLAVLQETTPC